MNRDVWLNVNYACGLLIVNEDKTIVGSAPIYKWMRGKKLDFVVDYLRRKGQLIEYVYLDEVKK